MSAPPAAAARYAGTRVPRVEDPRLLTGHGTFVDDVVRPGMLHAHFVRSPLPRARVLDIEASEALALRGVRAVFTARDLNPDVPDAPRPPLAEDEDEVRFVGDPVALIVADDRYIAEDAAEPVLVDYEALPPVVDYATAHESEELVHPGFPGNLVGEFGGRPAEELAEVFERAAHVARETIHQQTYAAVPMETRGLIAEWSRAEGEMTIWASTQTPHETRLFGSRLLGVDEHRIRVVMRDPGGGFGQKAVPQREDMCVLLAARKVPAALKWIEYRQENLMSAGQGRHEHGDARIAFDEDGNPLTTTFMDYLLPASTEVPTIEYGHVESPGPGEGGYKGVGEGGAIGAPPAVVNAVADALAPLGVKITRLPVSPAFTGSTGTRRACSPATGGPSPPRSRCAAAGSPSPPRVPPPPCRGTPEPSCRAR
ncbi:xanthine dehydrogenase family protein molybdopterin-binding subunit [Actinomadura sp. WMMB 499]|uniref:xanthine dehydrogenase family protein molybdopterin-binding subunit n=1 Tax=Actinomadura sp. WMMB 499 TaxID=1219491 RepID=UPI001C3F9B57|nr:molybdopterin cofactor-binding domain-containing protein [Actinomadura sp. WMMB 499]